MSGPSRGVKIFKKSARVPVTFSGGYPGSRDMTSQEGRCLRARVKRGVVPRLLPALQSPARAPHNNTIAGTARPAELRGPYAVRERE